MTIRRRLFTPIVLWSLVAVAGQALYWPEATAQATADPASLTTTALVGISGVVTGRPESVLFRGLARVDSRLAPDPDFNKPRLVLTIDLTDVAGAGSLTKAQYVIAGPETVQRRLATSHAVEITFPFSTTATRGTVTEGVGVASFDLSFDLGTGAVTSATARVSSPSFAR